MSPHAHEKQEQEHATVLVIFDYDWSLVNENSDTYIFQQLYPELLVGFRARWQEGLSWPEFMDELLSVLSVDKPHISADTIRETIARVPVQHRMLDAVKLAVEDYNAVLKIVSDANTIYINSMLEHHDIKDHVSQVVTNPAHFEADSHRLRIHPHHAKHLEPHGCVNCPTNMCKGRIVDEILQANRYAHVLYVGDGTGDFCAATRLSRDDVVFARADAADGRSFGLLRKINTERDKVKANVITWSTGEDIYNHFAYFFQKWKQQTQ